MTDLMFTPANFEVPTGAEVTLNLSNNGAVEHNFIILKKGINITAAAADIQPEDMIIDAKLAAGESGKFTFKIDEAGEYEVVCNIPGHLEAGMVGKIVVK
jgi:uncharacterized cupredoxin-like copper-binding protein